jgi:hypothetical protein
VAFLQNSLPEKTYLSVLFADNYGDIFGAGKLRKNTAFVPWGSGIIA